MRRLTFVLICLYAIPATAQQASPPPGRADTASGPVEPAPNQVEIGGRLTTVFVEPTRFQRYGDFRDGQLLISLRFGRDVEAGYGTAHNASGHDFRISENTVEHVLRFGARRAPSLRPTANPATNGSLTVDASVTTAASVPPQ